jgi:hypothetical protein
MRLPSRSKLKSKTIRAERCGSARMVGALESKIQVRPIPPIVRMTMRRHSSEHTEFSPLLEVQRTQGYDCLRLLLTLMTHLRHEGLFLLRCTVL